MKIFFQFKKKRKGKEGGEWRNESRGKKQGIRISFVSSSRSSFSLFLSPPILETNSEFLKVETFALAGAQLLKLSITGPPTPSPSSSLLLDDTGIKRPLPRFQTRARILSLLSFLYFMPSFISLCLGAPRVRGH